MGGDGIFATFRGRDGLRDEPVLVRATREPLKLDAVRAARFARETEPLERLRHEAIVGHVAHGSDADGALYVVTEWLEDEPTLADVLAKRASLEPREAVTLASRVVSALEAIHGAGVVHRNVKPSSIRLSGGSLEAAKLDRFFIAMLDGDTPAALEVEGAIASSYMAPEAAKGLRVDARSDVFSLGCLLFRCLTGRAAYTAETALAVMTKVILDPAPKIAAAERETSPALAALVDAMVAKDPKSRPSARAVLDALGKMDGFAPVLPATLASVAPKPAAVAPSSSAPEPAPEPAPASAPAPGPPPSPAPPASAAPPPVESEAPIAAVRPGAIGERERQLLSVVLVEGSKTVRAAERAAIDAAARANGGVLETVEGAYGAVTFVSQAEGATQAAAAARTALAIRRESATARLAIVTGRSDGSPQALDALLAAAAALPRAGPRAGVPIDSVTAGLLDRHFSISEAVDGFFIRGEADPRDAARTLLGKRMPFVGREAIVEELLALYTDVVENKSAAVVMFTGGPGMGKSRLAREVIERLEAGSESIATFFGRGDFTRRAVPLGLMTSAFSDFFGLREGEPDEAARQRIDDGLRPVFPNEELDRALSLFGVLTGVPFPEPRIARFRKALSEERSLLFDHVRACCLELVAAELSRHPVVFVLDDLHEADEASLGFVAGMLRTFSAAPLLVLALARPELEDRFPDVFAQSDPARIALTPLAADASAKLVRAALGSDVREAVVENLVARAQGNAFFLEELVRNVASGRSEDDARGTGLPTTLLAVVDATLDDLSPICRRVLRVASIFGQKLTVTGLRAVLPDGTDAEIQRALDDLVDRELLGRAPGSAADPFHAKLFFRSEIVRVACYEALTDEDRARGHLLAGEWLESTAGEPSEIARHYALAGDQRRASQFFMRASEVALDRGAFSDAATFADRAVEAGSAGLMLARLRLLQAEAQRHLGDSRGMLERSLEAMKRIPPRTPAWWTAAADAISGAVETGQIDRAGEIAKEIASGSVAAHPDVARIAMALFDLGRYREGNEMLDAIARGLKSGWVHRALACRAMYASDLTSFEKRTEAAVKFFDETGEAREAAAELVSFGFARQELGLYPEAEEALRLAYGHAERMRLPRVLAMAGARLGSVLMRLGRSDEAERYLVSSIAHFEKQGNRRMEGLSRRQLGLLHIDRGALDPAFEEIMHASQLLSSYPPLLPMALAACARVMLATNRATEALLMASDAIAALSRVQSVDEGEAFTYLVHAEALRAADKVDASDAAIRAARDRLIHRSTQLEASQRRRFLDEVHENRRTMELALEWLRKIPARPAVPARIEPLPPRRKARMRLAGAPSEPPEAPPKAPRPAPPKAPRRVVAIVLAADPERRAKLEKILGAHGADVLCAKSPGELFYLLDSSDLHLVDEGGSDDLVVFLDPLTPGLEGPAFVELLRRRDGIVGARIVLAGGLTIPMMRDAAEAWGADGFVAMNDGPVDPEVALRRWVEVEEPE